MNTKTGKREFYFEVWGRVFSSSQMSIWGNYVVEADSAIEALKEAENKKHEVSFANEKEIRDFREIIA